MSITHMHIKPEHLEKLRFSLKRGDYIRIGEHTGFSTSYISMVLRGLRENQIIIDSAVQIANERQAKIELANKKIAAL